MVNTVNVRVTAVNLLCVLLTMLAVIVPGFASAAAVVAPQPVLVASGHPEWAPVMWKDGNLIVGTGPDLLRKICSDLGIECVIKYEGSWSAVQDNTRNGKNDMLVAAYKSGDREKYYIFSEPYLNDPIAVFARKDSNFKYSRWSDLQGKRGVVLAGDSYGQRFDDYIKSYLQVTKVDNVEKAFGKLRKQEADYFVYARYSGKVEIVKQHLSGEIEALPQNVTSEKFYFALSKLSPFAHRMPEINRLLAKYIQDGTVNQLLWKNEKLSGIN